MQAFKEFHGSCHCSAIKFKLFLSGVDDVEECNCEYCNKAGILWARLDRGRHVTFEDSEALKDKITKYKFARKRVDFSFCRDCGSIIGTFENGLPRFVNLRLVPDYPKDANPKSFDGAANYMSPARQQPEHLESGQQITHGSCHCGLLTWKLASETPTLANPCQCSICSRNAYQLIYPSLGQLSRMYPLEHTSIYYFGPKRSGHVFCNVCGIHMGISWREKMKWMPIEALNLRVADHFDLKTVRAAEVDLSLRPPKDGEVWRGTLTSGKWVMDE